MVNVGNKGTKVAKYQTRVPAISAINMTTNAPPIPFSASDSVTG
jgi:hypothetical protein